MEDEKQLNIHKKDDKGQVQAVDVDNPCRILGKCGF